MPNKKKRLLYILNPMAGKGQGRNSFFPVVDCFTKAGYLVTACPTQQKLDATRLALELSPDYDMVVCCGGDGTLHEVVGGVINSGARVPIGYIPAGSANDFAASHNLPRHPEQAARVVVEGEPFDCDVGSFNGRYFTYIAAFGAFTDVAYETPQEAKTTIGHLAYILQGMTRLHAIKAHHVKIEHDGGVVEDDFIYGMVTNSTSVGGFRSVLPKGVRLDDGLFEVMLIRHPRSAADWQHLLTALAQQRLSPDEGFLFSTSCLRMTAQEPVPWTLDGEYGGSVFDAEIISHQNAMTILHPSSKQEYSRLGADEPLKLF